MITSVVSLGNLGANGDTIKSKALELKAALNSILKIASDQSKSMTDEYLQRQNRLEETLLQTAEKKSQIEKELVLFSSNKMPNQKGVSIVIKARNWKLMS